MRKAVLPLCLSALCLAAPSDALAQTSRIYMAGYMGLNVFGELNYEEGTTPASGDIEFNNAPMFAGALGLRLSKDIRLEAELSHRKTDLDSINVNGANEVEIGGEISTTALMLNGYYDFDLMWRNLQPFLSAGVGMAWHDGEIDDLAGITVDSSDDDLAFAWQLGGGLKYRLREDLAFTGGYRYFGTSDLGFESADVEYSSHELRIGVEYDLGYGK